MFHLLANSEAGIAAGASLSDIAAVADAEFTTRNSHFIFTEPYNAIAMYPLETSVINAHVSMPKVNAIARHFLPNFERSATVPDLPNVTDYRDYPFPLSVNEEIAVQMSNDLAMGTEVANFFTWIAPPGWNRNLPRGLVRTTMRATVTVNTTAQLWSVLGTIVPADNIRGGWYSIVGAHMQAGGTLAFRFIFPKPTIVNNRKLRPGGLCTQANGNENWGPQLGGLGEWGRFHSFELPQVEVLANATAAGVLHVLHMDVVYLGEAG